jgi:hypothetical protein
MKLIKEIINELSDKNPNLENVLMKTKILLHKLGEKSLVHWVNNELNGYSKEEQIPEYRIIHTRVLGTVTNGYTARWNNYPLPISHLKPSLQENFTTAKLSESIASLEHLASSDSDTLSKPIQPEFCPILSKGLADGIVVEVARQDIGKSQIINVLTQIRSRLLDFVLDLSDKIPEETTEEEVKKMSKEINAGNLFNNAMFGDNATIVLGDHNTQSIKNIAIKNDFNKLAEILRANKVSEEDITKLQSAIKSDVDNVDHANKEYGPNVKGWVKTMLAKAVDSTWQINLGVASSLIASALSSYYGWFK